MNEKEVEMHRLKKELAEIKTERDFLKKALAPIFFNICADICIHSSVLMSANDNYRIMTFIDKSNCAR